MSEHSRPEAASEHGKSKFVEYMFFKVSAEFRRHLPEAERRKAACAFVEFLQAEGAPGLEVRPYSLMGLRADCEFLLWVIASDLMDIHRFGERLQKQPLARWLDTVYSFTAMTKRGPYGQPHEQNFEKFPPSTYTFVYPFIKSKEWYLLPKEERGRLMREHIEKGREFPSVKLNTMYCFGLDDYDFMLAFETESPSDFSDLVQHLRGSEVSRYTVKDNPMLICVKKTPQELIDSLGLV
jgi:chlorite dismutase